MNKNLSTYATLFTETPEEAKLFESWLDEREGEREVRAMQNDDHESVVIDDVKIASACSGYDKGVAPGQIRLLSKRYTEEPWILPYVVVLEKWDDAMWLVAPFSQYATPATPGEMSSGIDLFGQKVIQAWNARTVQEQLVEMSFLCGELDESVVREAAALFRNQLADTELPDGFSALRGPAIIMDADPRREYIAETVARLRPLSTAVHAMERIRAAVDFAFGDEAGREKETGSVWRPFYGREDCALAAGGQERQRSEVFKVEEAELSVTYSPEDGVTIFTFYGCDDEPDGRYDGYGLIGGGKFLGTFRNGTISVPSGDVKDWYQVVDRSGNEISLARK